jgi:hypothetical protein
MIRDNGSQRGVPARVFAYRYAASERRRFIRYYSCHSTSNGAAISHEPRLADTNESPERRAFNIHLSLSRSLLRSFQHVYLIIAPPCVILRARFMFIIIILFRSTAQQRRRLARLCGIQSGSREDARCNATPRVFPKGRRMNSPFSMREKRGPP